MSEFKVGDRVVCYNCTLRRKGNIIDIDTRYTPNTLVIQTDDDTISMHPKQCRRLVKKKRREVWVHPQGIGHCDYVKASGNPAPGWVRFVEAKQK
jgi:hypothetical protein